MSFLDRVRDLVTHPPEGEDWDDTGVEDVAVLATTLAAAWDAQPDDRRPAASRAATLGAFAAAMSRQIEPGQGAAGRALSMAGAVPEIRWGGRRPAFILVTAGVLLAMSLGTVVASAPGGPLYDARVAAEGLLLPPAPDDRAAAEVERLEARVAEATDAAERGDTAGVSAALRAYARIATEAAAASVADSATLTRLAAQVRAQQEIISRVGAPDPVREQVRLAVRALLAAFEEPSDGAEPGAGPGSPGMPTDTGGPATSASPRASAAPGGLGSSPSPSLTAGPRGSSGPASTASPKPSASPQRTPAPTPRASTDPSPGGGSGSGPGSTGGGGRATPRPSGGSSQSGAGSGAAPPPGGRL